MTCGRLFTDILPKPLDKRRKTSILKLLGTGVFKGNGRIDLQIARVALEALNIDRYGLDEIDNKILTTIINKFQGGPVGINTIATAVGEDAGTVEEVYEPFLIKEGFIKRTPRGREVTELAYRHLGIKMGGRFGNPLQGNLFD